MAYTPPLLEHLRDLISSELWTEALLHLRHAAEQVRSRGEALRLREVGQQIPADLETQPEWSRAMAWVAYRTADLSLLDRALAARPGSWSAFEAFRASVRDDWAEALRWAEVPQPEATAKERAVAARFRASALAELRRPAWTDAYREAVRLATGRDRGLALLEWGHYLASNGQEAAARDAYAEAVAEVRGDDWSLTLAHANLGITCLRLGLLAEAERALRLAAVSGQVGAGMGQLSVVWRGLGGLALHRMQLVRAMHAFELALQKADTPQDRVSSMRGQARVYRMQGRYDEAMQTLHGAVRHDPQPVGAHPFYADLAALALLVGDAPAARQRLGQVRTVTDDDVWRVKVVKSELRRLDGESNPARGLQGLRMEHVWAQEEARIFPDLFALLGVSSTRPVWTAQVRVDGPVGLTMSGDPVPIRSDRASASLLAFLVLHQGQVSSERALEGLDLPGSTVRDRKKHLSKVVAELREVMGWPGAVSTAGGLLRLHPDIAWDQPHLPAPARADLFCEGRLDPWVLAWRSDAEERRSIAPQ